MHNVTSQTIASKLIDKGILLDQLRCEDQHKQEMLFLADRLALKAAAEIEVAMEMGVKVRQDA